MRGSGILMHITSLPGVYGVGTMGKQAFGFVDFLKKSGQNYWQILPLNPTGYGDSPYQSCSAFAGNPYLIDFEDLVDQGLLEEEEITALQWNQQDTRVDFGLLYQNKLSVLYKAFQRFSEHEQLDAFCREQEDWLSDFTLYLALKDENGGKPWYEWKEPLKTREILSLQEARKRLAQPIRFYSFVQYVFYKQWLSLRTYANDNGIRIIGDVPIYVPLDSVDVWVAPQLFQLDETLTPVLVAGCPPDAFSEDGQLWGNPLYRWEAMEKDGYCWWLRRLASAGKLYDIVRLDHFRGFESYWAVPYGESTARNGSWLKGPGMALISTIQKRLPYLQLIAEDLGFLTREVLELRDASGLPGMKILQFAFDSEEPSTYLPHNYGENTVCYTGTHDNMTMKQWFDTASSEAVTYAAEYMALTRDEGYVWGAIRSVMASVSDLCIIPMQDYLELGEEGRMNLPGSLGANWTWRVSQGCFTQTLAEKIYGMTKRYGRLAEQ